MKRFSVLLALGLAFGLPVNAVASGAGGAGGGGVEFCNGVDDDGDGAVDEGYDDDGDGAVRCRVNGEPEDCDDADPTAFPGGHEVCDGADNDCDYTTDEGFDADGDTFTTCGGDCDDSTFTTRPGADEICNFVDDDCDGATDEDVNCPPLMLDGFVYADYDCDGVRGDAAGLPNRLVVAVGPDCDGDGHADTVSDLTDEQGIYWIMPTCPGDWTVGVVLNQGETPTSSNPATLPVPDVELFDFGVGSVADCGGPVDCPDASCGDGTVDPGEECDDGNNASGDGCQADCRLPRCGDGTVDPGEECDDGNAVCSDACRDCRVARCGDGDLDFGEQCDDGNNASGDGCQADCSLPRCGDGVTDPNEQCDDGNTAPGDGCDGVCMLEVECALALAVEVTPDEIIGGPTPDCDSIDGKPTELTFRYTGGGCAASANDQDEGKTGCAGGIDAGASVQVEAAGGGGGDRPYLVDLSPVAPGEIFSVFREGGDDFESESHIWLRNMGGQEAIELHTSCSQPLQVGDVFGSLTLVAINGEGTPATDATWTYTVTNNGSAVDAVTLTDSVFGVVAEDFALAPGESRSFTVVDPDAVPGEVHTASASGTLANGAVCDAEEAGAEIVALPPPATCEDGKPQVLEMEYTAGGCADTATDQDPSKVNCTADIQADPVFLRVTADDDPSDTDRVFFEGQVGAGEVFAIDARAGGEDKLKSETHIHAFDANGDYIGSVEFHTSCSQPLNVGDVFGGFLLTGFTPEP